MLRTFIKKLSFLYLGILLAKAPMGICGTQDMPVNQVLEIKRGIQNMPASRYRDSESVHILVAWHEIQTESGQGYNSIDAINACIEALNEDYLPHNIFFTLDTVNRVVNNNWFNNWYDIHTDGMQALSYDPYHYLNIYTADLLSAGVQGFAYLGNQFAASHPQQSVNLDHDRINSTWVVTHDVGHHLGLPTSCVTTQVELILS